MLSKLSVQPDLFHDRFELLDTLPSRYTTMDDTSAEDRRSFTVTIECDVGNEYDGRLGLRISAIFVILTGSLAGCLVPMLLARQSHFRIPSMAFFVVKYFGSGVIISTSFIHLLAPAIGALYSPCLSPDSIITQYPWPEGICLMSIFAMFLVQMVAVRWAGGAKAAHPSDPSFAVLKGLPAGHPSPSGDQECAAPAAVQGSQTLTAHLLALFILEFGVIFHSVLIGLTLAVSGEEFVVLYVVLTVHQTFEGLGLGSRFATTTWPEGKRWLPYLLSVLYSLSTPLALAAGLGLRLRIDLGTDSALIVMGVFDAISAGILLYTGLVNLIAQEFLLNDAVVEGRSVPTYLAYGCMCLGAGLMALLGKWA